MLGTLVCGFGGDKTDANTVTQVEPKTQLTDTPIKFKTAAIEDVNIGERLLGKNPIKAEVDDFVPDIIPGHWRLLHLTMLKGNGKRLDMQFLRPLDWMNSNGAQLGATIDLDLLEFGAKGPAKVVLIEPCPPIKSGQGNVVTGKFIHESDSNLINLRIKGQQEPTTVTSNHRYWSADRGEFVDAGHLQPGEQVSTLAGLKQVISINPRTGNETVYNLEVQGEHVYLVGSLGTLVHNSYLEGSFFGKTKAQIVKRIPKNWRKEPADLGHGWKWIDENEIERVRYMYPNPNGRWRHSQTGYWKRKNADGDFLDVDGNVVPDDGNYFFNQRVHIPFSSP